MRRMRFPATPHPEESIPGALARGVRTNVLERSSIVFADTGLRFRKTGLVQAMPASDLEVVADWMGCDPALLTRQAIHSAGPSMIAMEDLVLQAGDIELHRRRIAPTTLTTRPFHRMDWLSTLLPYCPVSLERLVDACPRCGIALGWSRCWGIGDCERCRERIAPSDEPGLPYAIADDYRLFAALLSPVAETRRVATAALPEKLRTVAPGSLVTMAIRLGLTCRDEPITHMRRECVKSLPPATLAGVATSGVALLRDWPASFAEHFAAAFERNIEDLDGYHAVRKTVRRLGNRNIEDPAQAELVRDALPGEFSAFARSAQSGQAMTLLDMRGVQHLTPTQLGLVRKGLEDRRLPGRKVVRSQFNPEKVQEFSDRYRNSERLTSLTFRFMVPTYVIEQMTCLGLLDDEDDELVRRARGGACVTAHAGDDLVRRIIGTARRTDLPTGAISLSAATRRIGGREKPWGAIFARLRDGDMPFWVVGDEPTARTIKVHPADLAVHQDEVFRREDHPGFPFSTGYAKCEVEEILNTPLKRLRVLIERGDLAFRQEGVRHVADSEQVIDLAERFASFAELSAHTGWNHRYAVPEARALRIPAIGSGWCRPTLVEHGLIPPLPGYRPTFPAQSAYAYVRPPKSKRGTS